jgi:phosphohistidine phosphatase
MKTLILVRHAKSSWDDAMLSDFDRPLNDRGKRDAPRMAKRLKEKDLLPDLILSSPAKRALATATLIAEGITFPVDQIKTDNRIYHASDDELLSVVQSIDDSFDLVILFGHNPGLTEFANRLTESRIDNIPTCGILSCKLDVSSWQKVKWGKAQVKFFDYPKKEH